VASNVGHRFDLAELAPGEVEALVEAAAWYFNYHADDLARLDGDESAHALARRDHLNDLHGALWKLDVRLRHPARHA
jgi:hypothetical protein